MRLHPLSVPLRAASGIRLRDVLVFGGSAFLGGGGAVGAAGGAFVALAVVAVLFVLSALRELLYYQRFEYALTDDTLDIDSGVLSRRERTIPLRRIQNVDIAEDPLARLAGLAAVAFETAGGGSDAEGTIRYVTKTEAERLQNEIQRLKRTKIEDDEGRTEISGEETDAAGESPARDDELFALSFRSLVLASVLSLDLRALVPIVVVVAGGTQYLSATVAEAVVGNPGVITLVVAVGSFLASAGMTFVRYYDFRLWRADDELRYERGLVGRYTGSIPFEKIQNLVVNENPLERHFGFASLDVETAGSGGANAGSGGAESVVPLAEREAVFDFARSIEGFAFGPLEFSRPPKRARRRYAGRYVLVVGAATLGLFVADRLFDFGLLRWWFAPLVFLLVVPFAAQYKWRNRGVHAAEGFVMTRNGFWRRTSEVVPYYRVQTVIEEGTLFQRRWRLATVVIDTAGSRSLSQQGARAVDFEVLDAHELRETVRRRLRRSVAERRAARIAARSRRME